MKDYFLRQANVIRGLIASYQMGEIGLNLLVQKIEGLRLIIEAPNKWGDDLFGVVVNLEQINAVALIERRPLRKEEQDVVDRQLLYLGVLAEHLEGL